MTNLKLVESPEKKEDPRRHLVNLFNVTYKQERGKDNPLPFGGCMKAMQGVFKFIDQETGEITFDYPTEEAWIGQVAGMFKDEFCAKNRIYDFPYFLKMFGRFKTPEVKILNRHYCKECHREIPRTMGNICGDCEREQLKK